MKPRQNTDQKFTKSNKNPMGSLMQTQPSEYPRMGRKQILVLIQSNAKKPNEGV
uniref:Uncharacterized protein n=1 Tax=Nelumbo nucifera TaxID=4432 RepID=A0A822ZR07_NELNU|nr:TPA_asm: hypothetical protein HUJ06_004009 [Nelumbo nucifera]